MVKRLGRVGFKILFADPGRGETKLLVELSLSRFAMGTTG
jgi:hypothetical protein